MQPIEMYKSFLLKVNKNDTNGNVKIPKGQFVLLFNEQKLQWLDDKLKGKEENDYIEDLQSLLVESASLTKVSTSQLNDKWQLPDDFFRRTIAYAIASKDQCKNVPLVVWPIKPKDVNVYLQNSDLSPSFEWQETFGVLTNNTYSVYKSDFQVDEFYLSYYQKPLDIDIAGYTHIDGTPSKDQATNLDDFSINEILDRTATAALLNYESTEQAQLATRRQQGNEGTIN